MEEVYLDLEQSLVILGKVYTMRKENKYFRDALSEKFERQIIEFVAKNAVIPDIVYKFVPNMNKIKINMGLYRYLCNLTGVNPLNCELDNNEKTNIKKR